MIPARAPALIRQECWPLQRTRLLPLPGKVMVQVGQRVAPADVVATAAQPGRVVPVNVAAALALTPDEVPGSLVQEVGTSVQAGEVIARTSELFGLLRSECLAPCDGIVLSVSKLTGQVLVQAAAEPVAIPAYLGGEVVSVIPGRGVVVVNRATFVQGVYGVGGETWGELVAAVTDPELDLTADRLDASLSGKVVLGGAAVSYDTMAQATAFGVAAIVTGSVAASDLAMLRQAIWDDPGSDTAWSTCTLVITEGFGRVAMERNSFDLLLARQGSVASVSGVTQLRAGVVRPEVVITWDAPASEIYPGPGGTRTKTSGYQPSPVTAETETRPAAWVTGGRVKVIREPYFGCLGTLGKLPTDLATLPSGVRTRVAEVELDGGENVVLALVNLEPA